MRLWKAATLAVLGVPLLQVGAVTAVNVPTPGVCGLTPSEPNSQNRLGAVKKLLVCTRIFPFGSRLAGPSAVSSLFGKHCPAGAPAACGPATQWLGKVNTAQLGFAPN